MIEKLSDLEEAACVLAVAALARERLTSDLKVHLASVLGMEMGILMVLFDPDWAEQCLNSSPVLKNRTEDYRLKLLQDFKNAVNND